jgi:hypothetical protein
MPNTRIAEAIIAEITPSRKIDRIRNIWSDVQKLRAARFTYKQIAEQLPKYGIRDITYSEFHCICYRIRKRPPAPNGEPVITQAPSPGAGFDPVADAKRRREEKTRPIFQQRKET